MAKPVRGRCRRRQEALIAGRAKIEAEFPEAVVEIAVGDAGSEADVQQALDRAYGLSGRLDIVVPTVGGSGVAPFGQLLGIDGGQELRGNAPAAA